MDLIQVWMPIYMLYFEVLFERRGMNMNPKWIGYTVDISIHQMLDGSGYKIFGQIIQIDHVCGLG